MNCRFLLAKKRIATVNFEFGIHQVDSRHFFRDLFEMFTDFGYHMHMINERMVFPVVKYEYLYENL
jgi:hypothetical protein